MLNASYLQDRQSIEKNDKKVNLEKTLLTKLRIFETNESSKKLINIHFNKSILFSWPELHIYMCHKIE